MNDFDKVYWTFIFSAIGIALTFVLAQMGLSFRRRQDDKKNLKVVLFQLLEAYYTIDRSNPERCLSQVAQKLISMLPEIQRSQDMMANWYSHLAAVNQVNKTSQKWNSDHAGK